MTWTPNQPLSILARQFNAGRDQSPRIAMAGFYRDGNTAHVRVEPVSGINRIAYQVRTTSEGLDYDAADPVTELDCRSTRIQDFDVTITGGGSEQHVIHLIPMFENPKGTWILADGDSGPDGMWSLDLGS